jgi:predicted amidohydrolase
LKIRIGSYQGPIVEAGVAENLARVKTIIQETRPRKLDFLCFPEATDGLFGRAIHNAALH